MNVVVFVFVVNFIIFSFFLLLALCIQVYPFVFTKNPNEHVCKYKEDLTLYTKKIINSKNICYEFSNIESPDDNLKKIIIQYNKIFGIYYLSKYFYFSDKLTIYNSGIYRRREEMEKINDAWRRNL